MSTPHETKAQHAAADDKVKAAEAAAHPVAPTDPKDDEIARLTCICNALTAVCKNLGGNPDAVIKAATEHLKPVPKKPTGPMKKATVTPAHGGDGVEVEYPADAANADTAAVEAYKEKLGVWSLPTAPTVEHGDAPKKAKKG